MHQGWPICQDGAVNAARVLVVEDDEAIRTALAIALALQDWEVRAEAHGREISAIVDDFRPDLAILDVGLPEGPNGLGLARLLRAATDAPILFVTAADSLEERLAGFEAGGDDYVVKPFAVAEVIARARVLLRRAGRLASAVWQVGDLRLDEADRGVARNGVELTLTPTEYQLLLALIRRPGTVITKQQMLGRAWDLPADANVVEVHISALRRKLEAHGPRLIHTVRGAGYVLRQ